MSNKQLNEDIIVNELKGSSSFFKGEEETLPSSSTAKNPVSVPTTALPDSRDGDPLSSPALATDNAQDPSQFVTGPVDSPIPEPSPKIHSLAPSTETPNDTFQQTQDPTVVRTNERTIERTKPRPNERSKVRHSFDILADQLLALREMALRREIESGERVLLGDLVQEALDLLIGKEHAPERTSEPSNVRTNEPTPKL